MSNVSVARRKVGETWREAVERRGKVFGVKASCLHAFDGHVAAGRNDYEAAYLALEQQRCLWLIEGPKDPFLGRPPAPEGA